jgi:hypothetical protein
MTRHSQQRQDTYHAYLPGLPGLQLNLFCLSGLCIAFRPLKAGKQKWKEDA